MSISGVFVTALAIQMIICASLAPLMLLATFWKRMTERAAFWGNLVTAAIMLYLVYRVGGPGAAFAGAGLGGFRSFSSGWPSPSRYTYSSVWRNRMIPPASALTSATFSRPQSADPRRLQRPHSNRSRSGGGGGCHPLQDISRPRQVCCPPTSAGIYTLIRSIQWIKSESIFTFRRDNSSLPQSPPK
ncbi:MAG TPA: hypothetical protein GX513_07195 [Firmicutes bacterium]|nr:hypothetical protein [Bacillota bacterium]